MKTLVILMVLVGGCARTVPTVDPDVVPGRGEIVVSGPIRDGGALRLEAADGRVYAVRSQGSRFSVVLPAGVYDVTSIDGVRPATALTFNAIPGDRVELGSTASAGSATVVRTSRPETPLHYSARTGALVRPLPVPANWGGGSRVGMGLGLRSR